MGVILKAEDKVKYCYEIDTFSVPLDTTSVYESSYTFVSFKTLENIFPSIEFEFDILDQNVKLKEMPYHDRLESRLRNKLDEYPEIWDELAKI